MNDVKTCLIPWEAADTLNELLIAFHNEHRAKLAA